MPTIAKHIVPLAAAGLALVFSAAPLAAQDEPDATDRLRACIIAGSAGAPRDSLVSAVVAVRSLCHTQINRLREERLAAVDARFGLPEAELTRDQQEELERERKAEIRRLNDEIALAVANQTGLTL